MTLGRIKNVVAMQQSYVRQLACALQDEQQQLTEELARLLGNVAHIDNVVGVQQTYARSDAFASDDDETGPRDA